MADQNNDPPAGSSSAPPAAPAEASDSSGASDTVTINVKAADNKLTVTIGLGKTVLDLKKAVADQTDPRVEAENQRLIYSGRVLKDDQKLSEYKIQSGHSLHMVKGAARSSQPPTSSAQQVPTNLNTGQQIAGNPLAPLLNATNQIPGGFNPFADMELNQNDPNMAMNMMNNPQVLQGMANLLDDPAMVDQIIASDPRLSSMGPQVRQMLQSPMMRQMLTNPDMMRSVQQMMQGGGGPGGGGGAPFPPPGAFGGAAGQRQGGGATGAGAGTATATGGEGQQQQPFNPFAALGGGGTSGPGGGFDPSAFLNTPMGQMAFQQMMAGGGPFGGGGPGGGGAGGPNPFAGMFGGGGAGGGGGGSAADTRLPEERFEVQLGQLQGMGFTDARQNIRALQASGGSVEGAIEYILGGN